MSAEPARPLALVLVAAPDRRMVPALAVLPQLAGCDARALHIAFDPEQAHDLARYWMDLPLTSLPLQVQEPDEDETLAAAVRRIVKEERGSRPRITVIVPEMDLGRWWQPLLHRGTGRAVAWHLADLRGVTTLVVPVPIDLPSRSSAAGR
jgi:hypothetical protein